MKSLFQTVSISAVVVLAAVVGTQAQEPAAPQKAIAVLYATAGNHVTGTVTFTKVEDGVKIVADLEGLSPGDHGFHIHEFGDCSAPDGASAGGHFNPDHHVHGAPNTIDRHVGDLGNITADASGKGHYERVDTDIALQGSHSIIGHSVIVHAKADDMVTQPTGNAGARVACGVVGVTKP
jgi:Cu-Zn family superoxide dismutase